MSIWKKKEKAHEDEYFQKKEKEILGKLGPAAKKPDETPATPVTPPAEAPKDKDEKKPDYRDNLL